LLSQLRAQVLGMLLLLLLLRRRWRGHWGHLLRSLLLALQVLAQTE
jgi:hypothetical protein